MDGLRLSSAKSETRGNLPVREGCDGGLSVDRVTSFENKTHHHMMMVRFSASGAPVNGRSPKCRCAATYLPSLQVDIPNSA